MTSFEPDTLRLGDERDRLDAELSDIVDTLGDVEDGTKGAAMLHRRAAELDESGQAVAGLIDEYGADATVTVRGLSAGEFARVEDRVSAMKAEKAGPGSVPGSGRNVYAAAGLVDAPFYDGDPDDLDARIAAVAGQPVGVAKWLESLVNDRTAVDSGNWQPLSDRLAESSG